MNRTAVRSPSEEGTIMAVQKLIVIGAGPKAMAIASKNAVLAELGFETPEILIIEKSEVGANWTGNAGFTNGRLPLGTSPEKDVGFPYQSTCWSSESPRINRRMKDFSWQSFLVDTQAFSDWVDRGRPAPEHKQWAQYLQWVWTQISKRTACRRGEVTGLEIRGGRWNVSYGDGETADADGIVVTGPGKTAFPGALVNHDRLLTLESFWKGYEALRASPAARLAIVGTGENAAAIAMALAQLGNRALHVDIVSPRGMAYTRGESFRENRVYSHAARGSWELLSAEDRRNFIRRTDRGVFSVYAQSVLDHADGIDVVPGRVTAVMPSDGSRLVLQREYNGRAFTDEYDYIVIATGADQLAFLRALMNEATLNAVSARAGLHAFTAREVEENIDGALALRGLTPRLHLPMLSGLSQGPGFANLSCLGRLSDNILSPYVTR